MKINISDVQYLTGCHFGNTKGFVKQICARYRVVFGCIFPNITLSNSGKQSCLFSVYSHPDSPEHDSTTIMSLVLWEILVSGSGFLSLIPTGCYQNRHHVGFTIGFLFPKWLVYAQNKYIFSGLALTSVSVKVEICWIYRFLKWKKIGAAFLRFFI